MIEAAGKFRQNSSLPTAGPIHSNFCAFPGVRIRDEAEYADMNRHVD
jgi:hypothetical protein